MMCQLCRSDCELKNSHIIPEAFWEKIYDGKHRALPISLEESKLKFIQKGIYEKLLCGDCEQKISKWESILKMDLVDIGNKKSGFLTINEVHDTLLNIKGIRYKEFKLAIMSILWRMSIAKDLFFSSYYLGQYEEKIRKILLNEDFVDEKKYPIMVLRYELDGVFRPEVIMGFPPEKYHRIFTIQGFMIWGHHFMIFVNDKEFPKLPVEAFLRNSGELYINVRDLTELASSRSVFSKIYDKQVNRMYERMA